MLGVAVLVPNDCLDTLGSWSDFDLLGPDGRVCLLKTVGDAEKLSRHLEDSAKRTLLISRQSKSRRLFLYGLRDLLDSNDNLVMTAEEGEGYVMPVGGATQGLKGKAVRVIRQ